MQKNCTRCDVSKPLTPDHFPQRKTKTAQGWRWDSWCRECYKANSKRIQTKDPERKRQKDREWREKNSERYRAQARLRLARMSLPEKQRARDNARRHNQKLKLEALGHYGGALCKCCGETEIIMLALDHINNDGAAHRKRDGSGRSMQTYLLAKRNGWPPIYQVMCFNCNWARHWNNGICPHEIARQELTANCRGSVRINQAA